MQRLSALASVDAAARLEFLHRLFQLTATIAILDRTKMNPRISLSDLVAIRCYAVKDVAESFGRDATTISATRVGTMVKWRSNPRCGANCLE